MRLFSQAAKWGGKNLFINESKHVEVEVIEDELKKMLKDFVEETRLKKNKFYKNLFYSSIFSNLGFEPMNSFNFILIILFLHVKVKKFSL